MLDFHLCEEKLGDWNKMSQMPHLGGLTAKQFDSLESVWSELSKRTGHHIDLYKDKWIDLETVQVLQDITLTNLRKSKNTTLEHLLQMLIAAGNSGVAIICD
ncbi:hypothetical protein OAU50_07150 [Planctomycetota bacterium]|nr:hypothetical protein [Planctomycetota bacterium]